MNQVDNGRSCMEVLCKYGGANRCALPQLVAHHAPPLPPLNCNGSARYILKFLFVLGDIRLTEFYFQFTFYLYILQRRQKKKKLSREQTLCNRAHHPQNMAY